MDAAAAVLKIKLVQRTFQLLAMLQLTAIFWPRQVVLPITPDGLVTARYDFIIVGAGSAGCVLANRLSESPSVRVLLIEAGGDPPFETMLPGLMGFIQNTAVDWNFTEQHSVNREIYQRNLQLPMSQGKMLGGTSSMNLMLYVRGSPHDYQTWADEVGDQSWNYFNILQYFKTSEHIVMDSIKSNDEAVEDPEILQSKYRNFHGTRSLLDVTQFIYRELYVFLEMFRELGHKILPDGNGFQTLGFSLPWYTISNGIRQSTAYAFLRPAKHRHNLDVLKHTQVTKILIDDADNAYGVEALTADNKTITVIADKEVIVSAGGLNSPKLLLLSGIGPRAHLKSLGIKVISNLPVGKNLQDHVLAIQAYKFKRENKPPRVPNYSDLPIHCVSGYVALNKSQTFPDYQVLAYVHPNDSEELLGVCSFNLAIDYNICQALHDANKGREILFNAVALLHPKSRGKIELQSTNPRDDPLLYLNAYSEESDLEIMARSLEDLDRLRNSSYFKSVDGELVDLKLPKCKSLSVGSIEYWRCHALSTRTTIYHYSSACAMGSVLDARLRVRGVQGLRVADSSAMPYITSGNPNAAIIMLAEKAADMIMEDNGYYN